MEDNKIFAIPVRSKEEKMDVRRFLDIPQEKRKEILKKYELSLENHKNI